MADLNEFDIYISYDGEDANLEHGLCHLDIISLRDNPSLAEIVAAAEAHDCEREKAERAAKYARQRELGIAAEIANAKRTLKRYGQTV